MLTNKNQVKDTKQAIKPMVSRKQILKVSFNWNKFHWRKETVFFNNKVLELIEMRYLHAAEHFSFISWKKVHGPIFVSQIGSAHWRNSETEMTGKDLFELDILNFRVFVQLVVM